MTQKEAVLMTLRERGSITSWEAFQDWGITRLSAIIYDLRKKEELPIEAEDTTTTNRFGHATTFSRYFISPANRAALFEAYAPREIDKDTVVESDGQVALKV